MLVFDGLARSWSRFRQAGFLRRATARQLLALWRRLLDNFKLGKVLSSIGHGAFPSIVAHESSDIASASLHRPYRRLPFGFDNFRCAWVFHTLLGAFLISAIVPTANNKEATRNFRCFVEITHCKLFGELRFMPDIRREPIAVGYITHQIAMQFPFSNFLELIDGETTNCRSCRMWAKELWQAFNRPLVKQAPRFLQSINGNSTTDEEFEISCRRITAVGKGDNNCSTGDGPVLRAKNRKELARTGINESALTNDIVAADDHCLPYLNTGICENQQHCADTHPISAWVRLLFGLTLIAASAAGLCHSLPSENGKTIIIFAASSVVAVLGTVLILSVLILYLPDGAGRKVHRRGRSV
jgi:hypothetical protein